MNDPLGLFEEDNNSDPLGLFAEDEPSFMDKAKGVGEAAIGMVAGLPSQIAGGLVGGSQALIHGVDKGMQTYEDIQKSNFGFGEYRPSTAKGQEYTENVSNVLQKPVDWAGSAGEAVGGNAGRYVGELLMGSAMEMIEPVAIYTGARGLARRSPKTSSKVDAIRSEQAAVNKPTPQQIEAAVAPYKPNDGLEGQMNLFEPEVEGRGISPYEAVPGDWRIDENGMPIKADLSMDVQNMQNPLQRNLWGDELDTPSFGRDPNAPLPMDRDLFGHEKMTENVVRNTDPEAAIPLTEAIDSMPWAQKRGALKRTKMGREMEADGQLEAAKLQAEIAAASGDSFGKGFNQAMSKQRGVLRIGEKPVDVVKTDTGFEARVEGKVVGYLNSNLTPEQSSMLGENANVDIVKVDPELRGKGVGKALYEAWSKAQEGRIAPSGKTSQAAWNVWKRDFPEKVDAFINQEAQRIRTGSPTQQVLSNITDPAIRNRVATAASVPAAAPKSQRGALKIDWSDKQETPDRFSRDRRLSELYNKMSSRYDETFSSIESTQKLKETGSPEEKALLRALEKEDYLGFDYPHQAIQAIIEEPGNYDLSTPLKVALTRYTNHVPKVPFNFKKQGGGFLAGKDLNRVENSLAKSLDDSFIPENPDVQAALEKARTEKDSKVWTYAQSGGTSTAMKTGSTAIKAVSQIVQNATKRADLMVRNTVFPAEKAIQKLSKQEVTDLGALMKEEMFSGQRFDGEVLARNLSVKQLEAYTQMRDLFDKALDAQNSARLAKGQEPITPNEAYMSSRWNGDFRQPVHDSEGRLVWYLAAHTKAGLNKQIKELTKVKPDLVVDPKKSHIVRAHSNDNLQSAYTTLLDVLGRNDPAVDTIKKIIEEQTVAEGEMALAQEKHFKDKGNIRGFVGDRPGKDGAKEALAMFQQQVQYAKNGYKWAELQKASEDVAAIIADPVLQETQPNNVKYIREYFKNAIGINEAKVVHAINDTLREGLGVSPKLINEAIGNMKSFFITQKLVVSMGYMASNVLQSANVLPYLTDLRIQGIKGNPVTAVATGVLGALPMAMSHYMGSAGMKYVDSLPTQFLKDAFRYAEDNGVTARSVYDEAPVEESFNKFKRYAVNPAQKVTNFAETLVRSTAFMTFAEFLHSSGKYKNQSELFQKAEELTNMSMVDYRETERPLGFSKAGAAGNLANTLQTFPVSFYNQYAYMLGQVKKGGMAGILPLLTMLAVHYGMAGMMGVPGFDDADKLYRWMRDNALPDETWNKAMKSPFFSDPKMWILDNWGQGAVYGELSDETGIGMTSRVAAPGGGAMLQAPGGPILDIAGQIGSVASALADPTNTTKLGQAAMKVAPVGLQGLLETAPFMKDITYVERPDGTNVYMRTSDLKDRKGGYARTPEENEMRKFGVRSQKEVLTRDVGYSTALANQTMNTKSGEIMDKFYDAVRRGDTKKVKELATLYTDVSGKEISTPALEAQIKEEYYTDIEKQSTRNATPRQLMNAAKMQKLLESK
jgi:GNAT superfamily N-acetyltransferase